MKIELIVPCSTGEKFLKEGISDYVSRLQHYVPFRIRELASVKNVTSLTPSVVQIEEYKLLMKVLKDFDRVVLLDETGSEYRSVEFAGFLQKQLNAGIRNLCFVAGGPYGFSSELKAIGHPEMSLSKMTFTHQMIRLIFTEQLYRAFTILRGEGYHHE